MPEQSVMLAVTMDFLWGFKKNRNRRNTGGWKSKTLERALGSEEGQQKG